MAATPQIELPLIYVDRDPAVPGSGTPFDAAHMNPNFAEVATKFNTHTHGDYALVTDARFSDQRTPTDLSVTNAKVAANAAIAYSKLALTGAIQATDLAFSPMSQDGSYALATTLVLGAKVTGDTQRRLQVTADGKMQWGSGTVAPDTNLYRSTTNTIKTDGTILAVGGSAGTGFSYVPATASGWALSALVSGETFPRFTVGSDGRLSWGAGGAVDRDTNLYRSGGGVLQTDYQMRATNGFGALGLATSTTLALRTSVASDTNDRFTTTATGLMSWGPGNATTDTNLYRPGTGTLQTDTNLKAGNGLYAGASGSNQGILFLLNNGYVSARAGTSTGSASFVARLGTDVGDRLRINYDGTHQWSDGTNASDTSLYRWVAGAVAIGTSTQTGRLNVYGLSVGDISYSSRVATDTNDRFRVTAQGSMVWSDGTNPADVAFNRSGANTLSVGSTTLATNLIVYGSATSSPSINTRVTSDAFSRFIIAANGDHMWGTGALASDTTLTRSTAGTLQLGTTAQNGRLDIFSSATSNVSTSYRVGGDTTARLIITAVGAMSWGDGTNPADITLARSSAGTLDLGTSSQAGRLRAFGSAAGTLVHQTYITTDTVARFAIGADGAHTWGPGTAAQDTSLYRAGANTLALGTTTQAGRLNIYQSSAAGVALGTVVTTDGAARFLLNADGTHAWGPGNVAADTTLARSGPGVLQLGTSTQAGRLTIVTSGSTVTTLSSSVTGDSVSRWIIDGSGKQTWGPGGASSGDTNLYRSGAGVLHTDGQLVVGTTVTATNLFATDLGSVKGTTLTNTSFVSDPGGVQQSPLGSQLYHDLYAFNRQGTPLFETSADGVTFTSGTLPSPSLFNQKENQTVTVINGTTATAARWTWNINNLSFSSGQWLVLGFTFNAVVPSRNILFESSADGITWTQRFLKNGDATNSGPLFCNLGNGTSGDTYHRLTITHTNATPLLMSAIRLLSPRWGNQGNGRELSQPYSWDDTGAKIGVGLPQGTSPAYGVQLGDTSGGTTSGLGFGNPADAILYRSAAGVLRTSTALSVGTTLTLTGGTSALAITSQSSAANIVQSLRLTADTVDRFSQWADGSMFWGSGSAATDTVLFRSSANNLQLGTSSTAGRFNIVTGTSGVAQAVYNTTDAQPRLSIATTGQINWGPGASTATDTNLYRPAAATLQTDGVMVANKFQINATDGTGYIEVRSQTAAPVGTATRGRIYLKDNGSGKMQLVVQMPTGTPLVLATEA